MSVKCPYCDHKMRLKGAHPGRFLPACDRCNHTFILVIPPDPEVAMMVTPLDEKRRKLKFKRE